jgi:hypothetical protein
MQLDQLIQTVAIGAIPVLFAITLATLQDISET